MKSIYLHRELKTSPKLSLIYINTIHKNYLLLLKIYDKK